MHLQPQQLHELVESVKCRTVGGADLRREDRTRLFGKATVIPCPTRTGRKPIGAVVTDVSAEGIGLIFQAQLRPGEHFILRVRRAAAHTPRAVLCNVVHQRYVGGDAYAFGATFVRVLEDAGDAPAGRASDAMEPATGLPLISAEQMATALREEAVEDLGEDGREHVRQLELRLSQLQ